MFYLLSLAPPRQGPGGFNVGSYGGGQKSEICIPWHLESWWNAFAQGNSFVTVFSLCCHTDNKNQSFYFYVPVCFSHITIRHYPVRSAITGKWLK